MGHGFSSCPPHPHSQTEHPLETLSALFYINMECLSLEAAVCGPNCLKQFFIPGPESCSQLLSQALRSLPVMFAREVRAGSGMLGRSVADGAKGLVEPGRSGDFGRLWIAGLLEGGAWLAWGISPTFGGKGI